MKTAIRTMTSTAALTLVFGLCGSAFAQSEDPDGYGDGYQSGAYGRIRSADAGATIARADGERDEGDRASVNAPLFPGDAVRTDGRQRVEVQLAGGTIVRIDRAGDVTFQSLPNPSGKYEDNTVIVLNEGAIRVASRLGDKEEFRIDTRSASVYLLGKGEFRIETDDRGGTRVSSLRGVAEVVSNDASVLVRGGTQTSTSVGSVPGDPRPYSTFASDGFDRWCESREDAYRDHDTYDAGDDERRSVPDEVRPYYGELSAHGRWVVDSNYGTVWYPTGVASGWRPYSDGYWSYGPSGYFWVSYEPWGWAPYHYGNWQWVGLRGWCWVPGRVFAGAWVSWSWGPLYVGWAPLDFWGRPAWMGGPYRGGYYDPGCWTFLSHTNLHVTNVHRYAVPIGTVADDLRHATVVSRAPRVDPRYRAGSKEWRERALRQVSDDRAAHMRPTEAGRHPERRLSDVQNHMMKRSPRAPQGTTATPGSGHLTVDPRPRRILEDPRGGDKRQARPDTRDDVRELYQRMSRPRETRGQDAASPRDRAPSQRAEPRRETPSASRRDDSRVQPRRETPSASRPDAPRSQPRVEASRSPSPRSQSPRSQAPAPAKPKPRDKH